MRGHPGSLLRGECHGALPEEEWVKVVRFVIEHEESWIPTEFREAMDDAARGKMVDMERVMAGEKPPGV
jgi:hypothetical protein